MKKILLILLLAVGCSKEEVTPNRDVFLDTISSFESVNTIMSKVALLTLMSTDISEDPFDDVYLESFSDYLISSVIEQNKRASFSAEEVSDFILSELSDGVPQRDISNNIIQQLELGKFQYNVHFVTK